jgi:hypothetical protein
VQSEVTRVVFLFLSRLSARRLDMKCDQSLGHNLYTRGARV